MKYAIINREAPFTSARGVESLDLVLAAGSFGFEVAVFFSDDGVYQLISSDAEKIKQKNLNKTLSALPFYEVEDLFVLSTSLETRLISPSDLNVPVKIVEPNDWQCMLNKYDKIICF